MLFHLPRVECHGKDKFLRNGPALAGHSAEAARDTNADNSGSTLASTSIYVISQSSWQRGSIENTDTGLAYACRGPQPKYVPIKYTKRLAEAGIEPSVGSVSDSYDNALAETITGLHKAEVIHWRSFEAVEFATLEWVDWFNNRRPFEPIGNIPPAEAEANYDATTRTTGHSRITQTREPPGFRCVCGCRRFGRKIFTAVCD
jgi:transposase InsO family protein